MLQSELGILVAAKTHGKSLIPKNFTQIVVSSSCYVAETFSEPFLAPKSKLSSQANFGCIYRAAYQKVELVGEEHRISFSQAFPLLM